MPGLILAESAAPSTPASGYVNLYAKSDGLLYWKDDAGTEHSVEPATVPDADTSTKGIVELATNAEVATGTDTARVPPVSALGYHFSAAKAWASFNGTGTLAVDDSYNCTSVGDVDVGTYELNFTVAMANANYAYSYGGAPFRIITVSKSTTVFRFDTENASAIDTDYSDIAIVVHGDR
jgi:hypothetical protein